MTFDKFDWETGQATSIKTFQVDAKSYQKATVFRSKIKQYINKVAEFKEYEIRRRGFEASDIKERVLKVAVPHLDNPMHQFILKEMVEYGRTQGVKLDMVIIK